MFSSIQSLFRHRNARRAARRKPTRGPKHKLHFVPQQLEQRSMMTVVFPLTLYGPETDAPGRTNVGLQDPTVNLVFAGNWNLQEEVPLINDAKTLLNGPYLSGLAQYSTSGTAQYGTFWNDLNVAPGATLPASPSSGQLQSFLQNSISSYGPDPGANDPEHAPIEVVILDPASSMGDNGGFNVPGTYSSPGGGQENINMIFVGTEAAGDGVSQDNFTQTLSHELAERTVNNAQQFALPSAYDVNGQTKVVQVADGEQEHNYNYRLDGISVQAYWSDLDQAAIVPDFDYVFVQHKYVLTPSWNTQNPKDPILSGYDLGIKGDEEFDPKNSTVTIQENVNGTVVVDMGNEPVALDESSILNISDLAGGHLVIDDSADTSDRTITMGSNSPIIYHVSPTGPIKILPPISGYIKGLAQADIDYSYADTVDVKITGGAGSNDFVATDQQPPVPLDIQGGSGKNTLTGPDAVNDWIVSGADAGTLNTGLTFTGVQDLVGGASGDTFVIQPGGSVLNIDGGGTSSGVVNTLDYTAFFTAPVTVDLATGSATNVNGGAPNSVENIQSFVTFASAHMMFVGSVFHDVLGRAPDAGGMAYWTRQLNSGESASSVAAAIAHSDEYYANFVIKPDYLAYLGRAADGAGVTYWTAKMQAGLTDEQLEADLISSDEFYQNAGGTDLDWVDAAYQALLGRAPDAGGESYWTGQLSMGKARGQVALAFSTSPEREQARINADYMQYLGRPADPGGLTYWLSAFTEGSTNEDVISGFTGSPEYYRQHTS